MKQNKIEYKCICGTYYHKETSDKIAHILDNYRLSRQRIRLVYGDVKTGKSWHGIYDVAGTIGRSTGVQPIPILLNNVRSMGGGAILDHCIIAIRYSNRKEGGWIYRHPKYTEDE